MGARFAYEGPGAKIVRLLLRRPVDHRRAARTASSRACGGLPKEPFAGPDVHATLCEPLHAGPASLCGASGRSIGRHGSTLPRRERLDVRRGGPAARRTVRIRCGVTRRKCRSRPSGGAPEGFGHPNGCGPIRREARLFDGPHRNGGRPTPARGRRARRSDRVSGAVRKVRPAAKSPIIRFRVLNAPLASPCFSQRVRLPNFKARERILQKARAARRRPRGR